MKTFITFFLMSFSVSSGIVIGLTTGAIVRDFLQRAVNRAAKRKK